jgi:transposase
MGREICADYDQLLMFPPAVDDWVGPDHPARFVRDFVDSLDLELLRFRVRESTMGRPSYGAALLLKVWLYGYLNSIRSSRKLERGCKEHMGLIWLTGMQAPDHNTIWRFWLDNKKVLRKVFKRSVRIALDADLMGLVVHAVDGTKIMACSSRRKVWHKEDLEKLLAKLDESISEIMGQVERAQRTEVGEYRLPESLQDREERKKFIEQAIRKLEEEDANHLHPGEPDARLMKNGRTIELSYNAQAVADQKTGMVVAQDVVNDESDSSQLAPMLDQVRENLGKTAQENLADGSYASAAQIDLAEKATYSILTNPGPNEESETSYSASKPYHTSRFIYDEANNRCICPHGNILPFVGTKQSRRKTYELKIYRCRDYRGCPYRSQCSSSKSARTIEILPYHHAVVRQREKRQNPASKALLKARKAIVEPVFGWIKRNLGFRRWTVRGLENVKAQWSLLCTTINLKKLYRHWVDGRLILAAA